MNIEQLLEELDACDPEATVFIEIDGAVHEIHRMRDDSQGVYLVVDRYVEERGMR